MRRIIPGVLVFALSCALPIRARAWTRHDLITRAALSHLTWLDRYRHIHVDRPNWIDESLSTASFQVRYLEGSGWTSARDILIRYSDEPDWGMDAGLSISPLQRLVGGSAAYRDYDLGVVHGLFHVGSAADRAVHFYGLAMKAFKEDDPYWGFRELARCLRYVEDLGDPYRDHPPTWGELWLSRSHPRGLPILLANLRSDYEAYVANRLERELAAGGGAYVEALRDEEPARIEDMQEAAEALSDFGYAQADGLLSANLHLWPKRLLSTYHLRPPTEAELLALPDSDARDNLDDATSTCLQATSRVVQGVLNLARRQALEPVPPRNQDD